MVKKIIIWLTFIMFLADKYIDKEHTNYNAWIVIFLFWITWNTSNIKEQQFVIILVVSSSFGKAQKHYW